MHFACPDLFAWLEKDITVVAPSRLLANAAYQQFATAQIRMGRESWKRPAIVSLGGWLTASWEKARYCLPDVPTLLSPAQEHLLWVRVIEAEDVYLFDVDATAQLAARAARLVAEWEIGSDAEHWEDGGDARQFLRWLRSFRGICKAEGWISRADLWRLLPDWLQQDRGVEKKIAFPLMEDPFPAFARVLAALKERAIIQRLQQPVRRTTPGFHFETSGDEWDYAARWARQTFEADPSRSIGIFVPQLRTHRHALERIFRQIFYPGACRALIDERFSASAVEQPVFSIHAASATSSEPVVAGALQILQLAQERIAVADACAILRSPWIAGAAAEIALRASADLSLRRRRELDVSLDDIERAAARCPTLADGWRHLRRVLQNKAERDTFAGWSRFIGGLLQAFGWPGDEELSNPEQIAFDDWQHALSQLATLSLVSESVAWESALVQLRRLLQIGSVPHTVTTPIHILDSEDAQGLSFDAVLVTGLSDENWPPAHFASPLVPLKLQREQKVKGSSAQNLREAWKRNIGWLLGGSPLSFGTWSGRLGSLAGEFISTSNERAPFWTGKSTWQSYRPAMLDERNDVQAPSFEQGETVRGGTGIIKSQSLCPFRAFAEYRLSASSPEEGCLGYDGRERGGNLHKALELVWQALRTRDTLRTTPPGRLAELVEESAREAVRAQSSSAFGEIAASVEIERLTNVILEWLEVERNRQQPFTVVTVEEEKRLNLAGLQLRLRLDRIDRLSNGKLVLIDYKSGQMTANQLQGERPSEPQLLVYAASAESEVDGVFFGQVKSREARLKGISRERHVAGTGNQISKRWEAFLADSRDEVFRLAKQFKDGFAAVDPVKGACAYCAQKPLCRIYEQRGLEETER